MRSVFVAASLLVSGAAFADSALEAHAGHFTGTGAWKDADGNSGQYTVAAELMAIPGRPGEMQVISKYTYQDHEAQLAYVTAHESHGFFELLAPGAGSIGHGYCHEQQCHLSFTAYGMEETYTFASDKVYRVGSKVVNGKRIAWNETLVRAGDM